MYAIVEIAGQQFKVAQDQKLFVHRLDAKEGAKVSFDNVLLLDDGKKVTVGAPAIKGAKVSAKIESHLKGDKVIVFKKKRRKGYKVIEADDGEEALEILKNSKEPFDLMISDVVMPSMDGPTLLREGRDLLGAARIVFVSGYAEDDFSELLSGDTDVSFLPKPFTLAQLAKKVKDEIGESDANT